MLVIRADQLRILRDAQLHDFEHRMAAHVRSRFPSAVGPGWQQSLEFVQESMQIARTLGLEDKFDLQRFIEFRAEYGRDFHHLDWAAVILNDSRLSACGKMELIDGHTLFTLR